MSELEVSNLSEGEEAGIISYAVYSTDDNQHPIIDGMVPPNEKFKGAVKIEAEGNYYVVLIGKVLKSSYPPNGIAKFGFIPKS